MSKENNASTARECKLTHVNYPQMELLDIECLREGKVSDTAKVIYLLACIYKEEDYPNTSLTDFIMSNSEVHDSEDVMMDHIDELTAHNYVRLSDRGLEVLHGVERLKL